MKVTEVRIWRNSKGSALLGFADVKFSLDSSDNSHVMWKGVRIFKNKEDDGAHIAMPSTEKKDKTGKSVWYPSIEIMREDGGGPADDLFIAIENAIVKEYNTPQAPGGSSNMKKADFDNDDGVPF
jgi:DNA-binding cell septation regulator SpoVG